MSKWGFRSFLYKSKWANGAYQVNFEDPDFVKGIEDILEEGFEPFQILSIGTDLIFWFKKAPKQTEESS